MTGARSSGRSIRGRTLEAGRFHRVICLVLVALSGRSWSWCWRDTTAEPKQPCCSAEQPQRARRPLAAPRPARPSGRLSGADLLARLRLPASTLDAEQRG